MNLFRKLAYHYFSRRSLPYWCVCLMDCLIVYLSIIFVYALQTSPNVLVESFLQVMWTALCYTAVYVIGMRMFHTYSGIIRYSSFVDLQRVANAVIVGCCLSLFIRYCVSDSWLWLVHMRTREILLWSVLAMLVMWATRVLVKFLFDTMFRSRSAQNVYIFGVKRGGIAIAKSIRNQDPANYVLKGFVTDNADMADHILMGVRVHMIGPRLVPTMVKQGVTALFVSPLRSESLRANEEFVNALIAANIRIYMLPPEQEWNSTDDDPNLHTQLREVDIEDLLPRDKIEVDLDTIAKNLSGKTVLITGAAGSIGSEIVRQVAAFNNTRLVLIDQAETPLHDMKLYLQRMHPDVDTTCYVCDITNRDAMRHIFMLTRPAVVYHAAAYKHVPMMEDYPAESIRNNVLGTMILADLAVEADVDKFVMISTDKAVNPTNVMGCSKRLCEIYVQSLDTAIKNGNIKGRTSFVTTRFGNVLGSNGSVIPLFKEQIKNGGPITVTHPDIVRYFMLIPEACKLVLEAGTMGKGGEIFVFDMGKPVRIIDLAKRMIQLSHADIEIQFTGLREGEKLYEEVLNTQETTLPSFHPKIKIARVRIYDYDSVHHDLLDLVANASTPDADEMDIVRAMKALVPEYRSQHSRFEVLDK